MHARKTRTVCVTEVMAGTNRRSLQATNLPPVSFTRENLNDEFPNKPASRPVPLLPMFQIPRSVFSPIYQYRLRERTLTMNPQINLRHVLFHCRLFSKYLVAYFPPKKAPAPVPSARGRAILGAKFPCRKWVIDPMKAGNTIAANDVPSTFSWRRQKRVQNGRYVMYTAEVRFI